MEFQSGRIEERDQVVKIVVEVSDSHERAAIPQSLFDAEVERVAPSQDQQVTR